MEIYSSEFMDDKTTRPPDVSPDSPTLESSGAVSLEKIGPYRILELLGTGGMGEVYKAEQRSPIKRTVAIKIIKLGFDSREIIARFDSERQALARMDHPHVARVLDGGVSETGRPYFVMEYVPGKPITQFCDDNQLSIKERLELFTQACDAIAHAHTKAIIHRDIKAANVLAFNRDGKPTVKVIDFGIAKALTGDRLTNATFNTQSGHMIGTYASMSPEQADGSPDIDTRSDVYSLGVLLYELLTGSKPFDQDTLVQAGDQEIKRIIREVEPPRPSMRLSALGETATRTAELRRSKLEALEKQLRSELEWIPLKAMRKERARRYSSPLQFKEDIENYLEGKPLLAAPESRAYRVSKFVKRNARGVAASATLCLLLIGGVSFYIHSIHAEQARTKAALAEAEHQKTEAQKQEEEATQQAAIAQAVTRFQSDMLASADPNKLLGENVTVLQATHAAIKDLDAGSLKDQPLVEAAVRDTIGRTLQSLARYDDARPNLERALEIRRAVLPPGDSQIADSMLNLALLLHAQGKLAEAEQVSRGALEIYRRAFPAGSLKIAMGDNNLARVLQDENKLTEAEALFREALEIRRKSLAPGDAQIANVMENLGVLLRLEGKLRETEQLYREALEINRRALPAGHPQIANNLANLAGLLQTQGRSAEAEALLRESLEMNRKALPAGHPVIAGDLNNLAFVLQSQDKLADAEPLFREALEIYRKAYPPGHLMIATSLNNLGALEQARGKLADAESLFREAMEIRRKALPANHPDIADGLNNLAFVLNAEGKPAEAEPAYREALEIYRKAYPPGHLSIANAMNNLGGLLEAQGRLTEAEPLFRESLEMDRKAVSPGDVSIARYATWLGELLLKEGKITEAEPLLREAVQIRRAKFGDRSSVTARSAGPLAELLDRTDRPAEAEKLRTECGLARPTTLSTTAPATNPSMKSR